MLKRLTEWTHLLFYKWSQKAERLGNPGFECECCVGQEYWQGCYCGHHGCVGPDLEPSRRHLFWRWLAKIMLPARYRLDKHD